MPQDRARVVVNGGARVFDTEPGRPLLFALMSRTILVPSACGGRAICGQCRVRVISGAGAHNDKEKAILSPGDRAAGIHLSCQVTVQGDVEIAIPESALHARPFHSRVAGLRDLSPDLREIELDLQESARLSFKAGQYVQFLLPGTESSEMPVYRAYSIASPPSSPRRIRLLFGRVPGGVCSTYAFERLRVGDPVQVNGPFGEFFVREGDRELIFVAGGSGMAPIRSMFLDMAEKGVTGPVTLFCVARSTRDLVYVAEMESLAVRMPGLRVIPTLSQPLPGDGWKGEKGGVAALLARRLGALTRHEAYLCGSPGMIDASINVMRGRGLSDERIHFDKFS